MVTRVLRDALAETLRLVSHENGYETNPLLVITEPTALRDLPLPCFALAGGPGGNSNPEELTNGAGHATQRFVVQMATKDERQADAMLDDARNAIEATDSPIALLPGVEMVTLVEWSDPFYEEDVQVVLREATAEVRYLYARGGA